MRDMSWFGLKEEEEVSILLCLVIIWEETLLEVRSIFKVTSNFILLCTG